jgi:hypothetical protein
MKFQPKTNEELATEGLWQPGVYGFEILPSAMLGQSEHRTEDTQSKSGNDMIKLIVKVFDETRGERIVIDYLLEAMAHKLNRAMLACSLADKYAAGEVVAEDFVGKTGFLELKIEKDKAGQYEPRNAVKTYCKPDAAPAAQRATTQPTYVSPDDDDIPF